MQSKYLMVGAFALTMSAGAIAADGQVNHDFVQLDYVANFSFLESSVRAGGDSIDTTGYELEASYAVLPQLLVRGSYANTEDDDSSASTSIDTDTSKLGVSWLIPTGEDNVGIDLGLVYRTDKDAGVSLNGWGPTFGVRAMANDWLEISGRLAWLESDYKGSIDAELAAAWHITDMIAVSLSYEVLDYKGDTGSPFKDSQWQLGGRFSF